MSDAENNQDGELVNAEVVEKKDANVVTVPSGDGEVDIELQGGKTVIAPTSNATDDEADGD